MSCLPVTCASCGWTGHRKPGNLVMCPKCGKPADEIKVTLSESQFARAYEAWLAQCSEVEMVTAADLSHHPMWREILSAAQA